jgi:hypothetical protein
MAETSRLKPCFQAANTDNKVVGKVVQLGERNGLEDRPSYYADRVGAEVVAAKTIAERKAGGFT